MKKLIIVGSCLGRGGTSAMMGLLQLSGINLGGRYTALKGSNKKNPKGHFELPSIENGLLRKRMKCYPPTKHAPPPLSWFIESGNKYGKEFENIIHKEFGSVYPIAIKSTRLHLLPLAARISFTNKVFVINMVRNKVDRAKSIYRVISEQYPNTTLMDLINRVTLWEARAMEIVAAHPQYTYINTSIHKLVKTPYKEFCRIASILGIIPPEKHKVKEWIDPKLVNRNGI